MARTNPIKRREYQQQYRETHKAESAAYRKAHKAERAAYERTYYATHKADKAAYGQAYYEIRKAEKAAYREANKTRSAAYGRAHYAANREKILTSQQCRRKAYQKIEAASQTTDSQIKTSIASQEVFHTSQPAATPAEVIAAQGLIALMQA